MNKIAFLGFIFLINITIYSNEPEKITAYVNQQFDIHLCTVLPYYSNGEEYDNHQWKDEDHWQLINFDKNIFTILKYYSAAPHYFGGGDLHQ